MLYTVTLSYILRIGLFVTECKALNNEITIHVHFNANVMFLLLVVEIL